MAEKVITEQEDEFLTLASAGPYWNPISFQFMYAPEFQFQNLPGIKKYRYDLKDENGNVHSFLSTVTTSSLSPVWNAVPEGVVNLTVTALDADGNDYALVGARTFFRLAPFSDDLPGPARPYGEAAELGLKYALGTSFTRHWLENGQPDPTYTRYVYPSKMISSLILAMINYAEICPENSAESLEIAKRSADYLISLTPGEESPINGLPPTYWIDFRPNPETRNNLSAGKRLNTIMMVYPALVATSYVKLEKATGEKKYLDAALKIGEYYRTHVDEKGSWPLVIDKTTGKRLTANSCLTIGQITPLFVALYERTGGEEWKKLIDLSIKYVEKNVLPSYNWEGQFEDASITTCYTNLSHYGANALARHYAKFYADDEEYMKKAENLVKFTEDQFVIWKRPAPWNKSGFDTSTWPTPCGVEQYNWHVPIDSSTADFIVTFLALYKAGRGEIYLEKAKALANSITRVQHENGFIPTHWMTAEHLNGNGTWMNCMFNAINALKELDETLKKSAK